MALIDEVKKQSERIFHLIINKIKFFCNKSFLKQNLSYQKKIFYIKFLKKIFSKNVKNILTMIAIMLYLHKIKKS
jgi:hypothetical protein